MSETAGQRAKRQKIDRKGRLSALEKLKQLKGSKHKYDVDEIENVYDTVDEVQYSERVLQRQEEDWIEDDGGNGYIEDGREIFDDDEIEDTFVGSANKDGSARGTKRKARVAAPTSKGNIRNLIGAMPVKKKEEIKTSEDSILSDIMSDIDSTPSAIKPTKAMSHKTNNLDSKREAQNYFRNLSSSVNKKDTSTSSVFDLKKSEIKKEIDNLQFKSMQSEETAKNETKIKEEAPLSATQQIEEFPTQEFVLDDNEFIENTQTNKVESHTDTITSSVIDEFMQDDFSIFSQADRVKKIETKPKIIQSSWSSENQNVASVQYDTAQLPLHTNDNGEKVLKFYWLDAWEDRYMKPGVVYLFGKVYIDVNNKSAGCVSCCVVVKNIMRKMFLLPREYKLDPITLEEDPTQEVTMMDIYNEFNKEVASKLNLKEFKSRKVSKSYAFNLPDVPVQSEYFEVKYSAQFPPPPIDKKYTTFSHIFGANTSSLEQLLLDRKIKGPCWLEIHQPDNVQAKVSWCKMEVNCDKMESIHINRCDNTEPPPLVIATLNMKTVPDAKLGKTKIVMLSCLVHYTFPIHKPPPNPPFQHHFCIVSRCNEVWPMDVKQAFAQYKSTKLTKCESERELLNLFLVQFWKIDPDLIVGHDLQGFQQDLLIGNILDLNIPNWSRLGRLKRSVAPQKKFASRDAFLGRLVCDIKLSAMELIRSRSFDLDTLCANVLKMKEGIRTDISPEDIPRYYEDSRDLLQLVSHTMQDCSYILKIMFELNVIPLALQITQIAGNVMSRTLMGGRSERNEFLLLHAFTEKEFIVPDKVYGRKIVEEVDEDVINETNAGNTKKQQQGGKKKPSYSGGLVLEPKKGFYDKLVLLMDFNSLYPSIIQEYNICFTTIKRVGTDDIEDLVLPGGSTEAGILPTQIRKLVESRREVKKLMKTPDLSPELYMQYHIRQMALKLTANSMYGCLGFTHSRFYAKPLAALVTMKGRQILLDTKEIVQKLNFDVIYGDTDSLMINTNCLDYDQVFKIGNELKKEINKKYRQIELDIDGVFRYLLLLKKKKYAAVLINRNKNGEFILTQEHKGLDIVRRDWSQLAAEAGKFILAQILSEQGPDDRIESIQTHLIKLKEDLAENKVPLSMLTITKQLTKNPNEYADKSGQPHVQVAMRLNVKNNRRFKKGDIVPYIICTDGTTNPATLRAYHIDELKNSEYLNVDVNYYLAHQLHPVISRLCDPIEGMDAARVADCLGLDPSGYKQNIKKEIISNDMYEIENETEKYRQCKDFVFTCHSCKTENRIRDVIVKHERESVTFLEKCQNVSCKAVPVDYLPIISNQLWSLLRLYNAKYYESVLICEDPGCTGKTTRLPQTFVGGYPLCKQCEKGVMFREYSEKDLYLQTNFFLFLFDLNKQNVSKIRVPPNVISAFHTLKEIVEDYLSYSAYSIIDLSSLFKFFIIDNGQNGNKIKYENIELDIGPESEQIDALLEMGTY